MGGHARDYVEAMWLMLQQEKADDFVVATGRQYSVRDLCTLCFEMIGTKIIWRGEGVSEEGVDAKTGDVIVAVSPKYFRPTEVETLLGDPAKARKELGWTPSTPFKQLVYEMMEHDLKAVGKDISAAAAEIVQRKDQFSSSPSSRPFHACMSTRNSKACQCRSLLIFHLF